MKRNQPNLDRAAFSSGIPTGTALRSTGRATKPAQPRWSRRRLVAVAGAALVAIPLTWGVVAAGDGGNAPEPPAPADQRMPEELLRDWVNRGYIPRQALDDATVR